MAFCLLIAQFTVITASAESTEPTIVVSSVVADAGSEVEVTIGLKNNPGIVGMSLTVEFPSELTLIEVKDAGLLGANLHNPSKTNPYYLVWANDTARENFTANGTVVTLKFKINDTAEESSEFPVTVSYDPTNFEIFDKDANEIYFAIENGKVTVTPCEHSGGEATCISPAICEKCGKAYGEINPANHKHTEERNAQAPTCKDPGYSGDKVCEDCGETVEQGQVIAATGNHVSESGEWKYNENDHFHICDNCRTEFAKEAHKGGEATCVAKAVCEVCGTSYGEKDANNHKNVVLKNNVAPTCKDPGYSGDKVCEDCGTVVEAGHEIAATGIHASASGEWKSDKYGHFRICDGCQIELDRENHKGGEATCSSLAVCEICGTSYGEKNLTNHKNTEIRGKVSATCSKEGYSGDTYCLDCGEKIVSGKTLDKLKHSYKDEVVPPTFGKQGYTLHTCTLCGDTYKDNYTFYVPSETDPLIAVSSVRGSIGKQVKVVVSLKNNPGIVSMLLRLNYDENVLKLINVEDCGILGEYLYNPSLGAPYYLSWVNDTATENFTENGNIVILTFEILEDAPLGKTPISVSYDYDNFDIYDVNGEEVAFTTQNGTVDVANVLLGDVNGDGIVNNYDRLLLTRWLAKWPEALGKGIIEAAADVNCDGKVNNLDRLILTRHLAHWAEYATLPYAG